MGISHSANQQTEAEMTRDCSRILAQVEKELPGWVKRLRTGKVLIHETRYAWAPGEVWRSFVDKVDGKDCLMDLHGALYTYFHSDADDTPHVRKGETFPETPAQVAALLMKRRDDLEFMLMESRYRKERMRAFQGLPLDYNVPWWRN
jgi:hypothetical protein